MKKMKNLSGRCLGPVLFAMVLVLQPSSLLRAADKMIGTEGAAFMKIPTGSPRAQALGNNGVSLLEGGEAMGINPAGIASAQMREISFSHLSWIQEYSGQYMSYVHPIGQSVVGINLAYYGITGFDVRDSDGKPQYGADVKVRHGYASLAFAKGFFMEKFQIGAAAKQVLEDNYTTEYKNLVFDLGAILRLGRKFSLGWAGQNFSGKNKQVVKVNRLGGAFAFNPFITVAVEQKSYSDRGAVLGGGVELSLPEEVLQVGRMSLRAGYTPADSYGKNMTDKTIDSLGLSDVSGWSFGVAFTARRRWATASASLIPWRLTAPWARRASWRSGSSSKSRV